MSGCHARTISRLCWSLLLMACCCSAAQPPAGTLTRFNEVGHFDGSTGLLNSCVALLDSAGQPQKDADGLPQRFALTLRLLGPELVFRVMTTAPWPQASGRDCSGSFQGGVYRDQILIARADPALDGRVLRLAFDVVPGTEADLRLRNDAASLAILRNITGNSTALGNSLGSFNVTSMRDFSALPRPATLAITLPQCNDPQGDTNVVVLERDGVAFATAAPGAVYEWNLSALPAGEHAVQAHCSDEAAIRQLYLDAGLDAVPANFATSAPATGTLRVRLGSATATPTPTPAPGASPSPGTAPLSFQFDAMTSSSDRALIQDTARFATEFYQRVLGRTLAQSSTIVTSTTAQGCSNGGASAFTGARNMTLCIANQGWTVHGSVTRRKIIIHEMFHLLQFEQRWIGGPQPAGPHWMIEGAAEYLGWLGVVEQGALTLPTAQGCMLKEVADYALSQPPGLPNLSQLETVQSFSRPGPVYPLAMLGVHELMNAAGPQDLLRYGTALAAGTATEGAFQNAFSVTLPAFYERFPAYKSLAVPASYECRL